MGERINMGVIQGAVTPMTKSELIEYVGTMDLTDVQKQRVWNHWVTVQKIRMAMVARERSGDS